MSGSNAYRRDRPGPAWSHAKDSKEAEGAACDEILMNRLRGRLNGHKGALQMGARMPRLRWSLMQGTKPFAYKPHLASRGLTARGRDLQFVWLSRVHLRRAGAGIADDISLYSRSESEKPL